MLGSSWRDDVREILLASGWVPGRVVDTSPFVASWQSRGIPVNAVALQFCREFGGLTINHRPQLEIAGKKYTDFTAFDVVHAVDGISDRSLVEFSRLAGERLSPVGSNRAHMTVMIAPSSLVFAGVDNYLYLVGVDPVEALTSICEGVVPRKFGEWTV